jgi:hypothetical protein
MAASRCDGIVLVLVVVLVIERRTPEDENEDEHEPTAHSHPRCTMVTRPSATRTPAAERIKS